MKKQYKKPVILTSVTAFLLILGVVLNIVAYGFLAEVLTMYFGNAATSVEMTAEEKTEIKRDARDLAADIAREGVVLLDNNGVLPYKESGKKIDLLGYTAQHPYYGGSGSSGISDNNDPVTFAKAFGDRGWTVNTALLNSYTGGRNDANFEIAEPDPDEYWSKTDAEADLAIVVYGRAGGEGGDLPSGGYGADRQSHYLQLSENESKLLDKAAAQYKNLLVVINSANALELGQVKELYSAETGTKGNVDGVIWIGKPGYYGNTALAEIVDGTTNPSGKLTDTYAFDSFSSPAARAYGNNIRYNGDKRSFENNVYTNIKVEGNQNPAHYEEYSEGVYVGYRYYETAAELGYIDYAQTVQYPFGYGMSYTNFSWTLGEVKIPESVKGDSKFEIDVTVKNEGDRAGKDVVELYLTLGAEQLREMRLDHAAATLVAFAKTELIPAGESRDVTLKFDAEDIASYDDRAVYTEEGAYVIEAGEYTLSLRTDSHTDKDAALNRTFTLGAPVVYNKDAKVGTADTSIDKRPSDKTTANNVFGAFEESILNGNKYGLGVTYLGMGSDADVWTKGLGARGDVQAPEALVNFVANGANKSIENKGYAVHTEKVKTGGETGLDVKDFKDTPYDDPKWQTLVEQLTVAEMKKLVLNGGYKTEKADSVGKLSATDFDGPCGIYYFANPEKYPGCGYPTTIVLASTWNVELAEKYGASVAREASMYDFVGWYAPGVNIHRTPFSGRNFEYYSEDPVLSGFIGMHTVSAATEGGLICYMKHFVLNDTELNRNNNVMHWCTEQALREIYLKAFEYAVKADVKFNLTPATGMMSGFNYIGDRWCGASYELLTTVLRGELGFRGCVVTDYFGDYGYMDARCGIRAGNDFMLRTVVQQSLDSGADEQYYMQQACKNILYAYSRCRFVEQNVEAGGMEPWRVWGIVINVVWWIATAAVGVLCALSWHKVRTERTKITFESRNASGDGDDFQK